MVRAAFSGETKEDFIGSESTYLAGPRGDRPFSGFEERGEEEFTFIEYAAAADAPNGVRTFVDAEPTLMAPAKAMLESAVEHRPDCRRRSSTAR
jgi:hypothetical protein